MREKILHVFLFLCALVSVAVFAHSFVSLEMRGAYAQSGGNYVIAYLEIPEIIGSNPTLVSGQTQFSIRLSGTSAPAVTALSITLVSSTNTTQPLHCINAIRDTELRWRMLCDTISVSNGTYLVNISGVASDMPVVFVTSTGQPAQFGPISIHNQFTFTQPGSTVVAGSVPISVAISGDVMNARVHIAQTGSGASFDLQKVSGEPNRSSTWQRVWNTAEFDNGTYSISLTIQTLNGAYREGVITQTTTVSNQASCVPTWSCGAWSACTSAGNRTRSCSDGCGTNTTEYEPCSTESGNNSNTAPTETSIGISIVQPTAQASVSELSGVRAQVSGTVQSVTFFYRKPLSTVEYWIGNGNKSTADPAVWMQSWNTHDVPNGSYFLIARASNSAGQSVLSSPVSVAVYNRTTSTDTSTATPPPPPSEENYSNLDTDGDGAADAEELTLGTDATTPDTITSSDLVIRQIYTSNPGGAVAALEKLVTLGRLTPAQALTIQERVQRSAFEQPTVSGASAPDRLQVHAIQNTIPETGRNQFVVIGRGPINSYVTLYIYSNPIVVTTKTDDQGNFEYTLDSDLLDGKHEVYVTVNDETGAIIEKSAPLTFFIRSAQAITEEEYFRGDVDVDTTGSQSITQYIRIVSIVVLSLIAALGIGWLVRRKSNPQNP